MAYRQLDAKQALGLLRVYMANKRRPKKNSTVTIYTIVGYDERCDAPRGAWGMR
jgi:hypothetical protein